MMTTEEKIREVQQKHREQMKANREKVKARKARTHRLIVRGAIAERAIYGSEGMSDEEFQDELYRRLGCYSAYRIPDSDQPRRDYTPCEDSR